MINFNNNTLDDKTIESINRIASLSGESISQISEALKQLCNSLSESNEQLIDKKNSYILNPMEMKMLNKRLNDAYKKKNKKR